MGQSAFEKHYAEKEMYDKIKRRIEVSPEINIKIDERELDRKIRAAIEKSLKKLKK